MERYRQMLKGSLTPEMIKGLNIKGSLLEELIQKKTDASGSADSRTHGHR